MNLADLETLLAVARERSFSRAAERLRRTQPAVSLAIRRLEAACGERLLDRGQPPRLTPAGEAVARRTERMLWHRGRMAQELAELRGLQRGLVAVGANESTALWLLPLIEAFHARHPRIKLEVRRSLSRNIPAEVLAGDLDLGVVAYDPGEPALDAAIVYQDRLAFVVPPTHPLAAARRPIALRRLATERFIAHNVESPYRDLTVGAFRRLQVPLNITLELPTIESIKQLVARGLGVAFVPRVSARRELETGALCEVAIRDFKVQRPLRLLAPRHGALSHAAAAFRALALERTPA